MSRPLLNISSKTAGLFALFVVLYEFSTYIANDMIMPGMLQVIKEFNAPASAMASSLTAYMLGGASLQLFIGPISDRYGRRPVMLFGVVFFLLMTIILVCSRSIETFIAARYFQGMGMCFTLVVGYAAIQEIFEEMAAVRIVSLMANISLIAPLLGPFLGAVITEYYNWRTVFIIIGIFAIIALIGLYKNMPEPVGATLNNGQVIAKVPMQPRVIARNYWLLFKNKTLIIGTLAQSMSWLPLLIWIAISPLIIVTYGDCSIIAYGFWQIPIFTAIILGNYVLRVLTHSKSLGRLVIIGSVILIAGIMIGTLLLWLMQGNFRAIIIGLSIYGFGIGISNGPLYRLVLFSTEVAKGTASALVSIITMALLAVAVEAVNYIYATHNIYYYNFYALAAILVYLFLLYLIKSNLQALKKK